MLQEGSSHFWENRGCCITNSNQLNVILHYVMLYYITLSDLKGWKFQLTSSWRKWNHLPVFYAPCHEKLFETFFRPNSFFPIWYFLHYTFFLLVIPPYIFILYTKGSLRWLWWNFCQFLKNWSFFQVTNKRRLAESLL